MTTTTAHTILATAEAAIATVDVAHYSLSVGVNAAKRDGLIYVESKVFGIDADDVGAMGDAQESGDRAMALAMERAGFVFVDSGATGDGGYWSSWRSPSTRTITVAVDVSERAYIVEGCGADQTLTATSPEAAAREAAEWQYGDDGATPVALTWVGTGPDGGSVAEYRAEWVETIGAESVTQTKRIVVREAV